MRWFPARKNPKETPAERLIRVCVVSRDPALVAEVHKDLLVGFLTRSGYDFENDHPDFEQYCDVLFLDLRAAGLQTGRDDGLAFIDSVRKSVSHPPIVVLYDEGQEEFGREVIQRGAYDKLSAPLNMPQLRLALQRAYDFRSAESKLETFLSTETAAHEGVHRAKSPKTRVARRRRARPVAALLAVVRRPVSRPAPGPSRLAVGFVLGCVIFFAGLVAVRTILVGMGDALASAEFATDSGGAELTNGPAASADGAHGAAFASRHARPFAAAADFAASSFDSSNAILRSQSLPPGYEPAYVTERVEPRYSENARARHLEGTVQIRALIGKDGIPTGLARVSGDPTLAQIAMDAISLWRYEPATVDGNPVESEVIIPMQFQLPN